MKELLSNVGSGGGAPAAGAPAAAGGAAPAAEAPAEEKKEEEKEESDEDMVRIYSVCFYACQTLTYVYVMYNRALVSSTDFQAVVLPCVVFSLFLAFPIALYFPLHNTQIMTLCHGGACISQMLLPLVDDIVNVA